MKFFGLVMLCTFAFSITCLAEENSKFEPPTEIQVDGGYLRFVDIEEAENSIQPRYVYKVYTDGSNLNVRKGPGTNYAIVGQIANGSYVDVSFKQNASDAPWVYGSGPSIAGGEIEGYMHSDYLGPSGLGG